MKALVKTLIFKTLKLHEITFKSNIAYAIIRKIYWSMSKSLLRSYAADDVCDQLKKKCIYEHDIVS